MSKTVRLYFLTSRVVGISDVYVIAEPRDEPSSNFFVDTTGREYVLPDGYEVRSSILGDEIYDPTGRPCVIGVHSSGRPQLMSTADTMPVLREVQLSTAPPVT